MSEVPYFVSYDEALSILRQHTLNIGTEIIALDHLYNRILAEDLQSTVDDPRFDNSAMDGFAFQYNDSTHTPAVLSIKQTLQAGTDEQLTTIEPGQAVRIMTGAPIPNGADAILPIERCSISDDGLEVTLHDEGKKHFIRKQGENLKLGQTALTKGTLFSP